MLQSTISLLPRFEFVLILDVDACSTDLGSGQTCGAAVAGRVGSSTMPKKSPQRSLPTFA